MELNIDGVGVAADVVRSLIECDIIAFVKEMIAADKSGNAGADDCNRCISHLVPSFRQACRGQGSGAVKVPAAGNNKNLMVPSVISRQIFKKCFISSVFPIILAPRCYQAALQLAVQRFIGA